jgi:hypothetical protein
MSRAYAWRKAWKPICQNGENCIAALTAIPGSLGGTGDGHALIVTNRMRLLEAVCRILNWEGS